MNTPKKKILKSTETAAKTATKPAAIKAAASAAPAAVSTAAKPAPVKASVVATQKAVRVIAAKAPMTPSGSPGPKTVNIPKTEPVKAPSNPASKVPQPAELAKTAKAVTSGKPLAPKPSPVTVPEATLTKAPPEQAFELEAPHASNVLLAGDFTGWERKPIALKKEANGRWRVRVSLAPGVYHHRFMVDGAWADDPQAHSRINNPFGSANCVREVAVS